MTISDYSLSLRSVNLWWSKVMLHG